MTTADPRTPDLEAAPDLDLPPLPPTIHGPDHDQAPAAPRELTIHAALGPRQPAAELGIIGAALQAGPRVLDDVHVPPGSFYDPHLAEIWATILQLHDQARPTDLVSVTADLQARGALTRCGGLHRLHDALISGIPASATHWATLINDAAILREIGEAGTRMHLAMATPGANGLETLDQVRGDLDALADRIATGHPVPVDQILDETIDQLAEPHRMLATGWADIDHVLGGWRPGGLYVLGARPGGFKTGLALQAAAFAAIRHAVPALVVSIEMSRDELVLRLISQLGPVDLTMLERRTLDASAWDRVSRARGFLADAPLTIIDSDTATVGDIVSAARAVRRRHTAKGLDATRGICVIDYLQIVSDSKRHERREQAVSDVAKGLKRGAKRLGWSFLAPAQLGRGNEKDRRRPTMADLRESGGIEAHADVVALLYRDEKDSPDVLEVAFGKNRHGAKTLIKLDFEGHYARVKDRRWTPSDALAGHR